VLRETNDTDPVETREWLDSVDAVVEAAADEVVDGEPERGDQQPEDAPGGGALLRLRLARS